MRVESPLLSPYPLDPSCSVDPSCSPPVPLGFRTAEGPTEHKASPHYKAWADIVAEQDMMATPRYSVKYTNVCPGEPLLCPLPCRVRSPPLP